MARQFDADYGEAGLERYMRAAQWHLHKPRFPGEAQAQDNDVGAQDQASLITI